MLKYNFHRKKIYKYDTQLEISKSNEIININKTKSKLIKI